MYYNLPVEVSASLVVKFLRKGWTTTKQCFQEIRDTVVHANNNNVCLTENIFWIFLLFYYFITITLVSWGQGKDSVASNAEPHAFLIHLCLCQLEFVMILSGFLLILFLFYGLREWRGLGSFCFCGDFGGSFVIFTYLSSVYI